MLFFRAQLMHRWWGGASRRALVALALCAACAACAGTAGAGESSGAEKIALRPGAYEAGLGASLLSAEGSTRADFGLRGARFLALPRGVLALGAELAYTHVSSLDEFGFEGSVGLSRAASREGLLPFADIAAGIRREAVGSFNQVRYPVGVSAGVRALFSKRAAVRFEYRFRRVLHDPISDFSEHRIVAGLSIFWNNG